MEAFVDLLTINLTAALAFALRELWGRFPDKPPVYFGQKYLMTILFLNVLYLFLFWILGAYDRRQKRALLEDFVLIFGIISTGLFVLVTFLFMGRMWWMSRGTLYLFWFISIAALCLIRVAKAKYKKPDAVKADLTDLEKEMAAAKATLDPSITPSVSVVIVNTNDKSKLMQCLDSLDCAASRAVKEITVVDNASTDGTIEYLEKEHPRVRVVRNPFNLGYPCSVNNGIRASSGEYCLILNPDIIVIPGAIEVMLDHLVTHPAVAIAGCKLLNLDGTLQYSARRFLDLRTYLYRFTPLRGLMAGSALERAYLMQDWDHNDDRVVDWVLGGCMLARRKAFEAVGLMD
ncbi:MAG TPA: glycosyltransferase, partial [Candidatus Omnitrophota bacterium]|nr:glycosyltransferase [Candidatus Omnitrophota bacterium]